MYNLVQVVLEALESVQPVAEVGPLVPELVEVSTQCRDYALLVSDLPSLLLRTLLSAISLRIRVQDLQKQESHTPLPLLLLLLINRARELRKSAVCDFCTKSCVVITGRHSMNK